MAGSELPHDAGLADRPGGVPAPARRSVVVCILIGLSIVSGASVAKAEGFTDQGAWRAAAGAFSLETFDGIGFHGSVRFLQSVGVRLDPLPSGPPQVDSGHLGGSVLQSEPHGLYNPVDDVTSLGSLVFRPLNAGDEIVALGAWNVGEDDTLITAFFDAQGALIENIQTTDQGSNRISFGGIVSAVPAQTVRITPGIGNQYIGIDDLQVVMRPTSAPVPSVLPIGLAALVAGLTIAGLQRIRSTSSWST